MLPDLSDQYRHTWRVFARLAQDFDPAAWLAAGRGAGTPARLSFHILQSTKYYLKDSQPLAFASGKAFDGKVMDKRDDELPSQQDVVLCIEEMSKSCDAWLAGLDLNAENTAFPWAGKTQFGLALFLLRHTLFHTGELASILNESKHGVVEDHYVAALRQGR